MEYGVGSIAGGGGIFFQCMGWVNILLMDFKCDFLFFGLYLLNSRCVSYTVFLKITLEFLSEVL